MMKAWACGRHLGQRCSGAELAGPRASRPLAPKAAASMLGALVLAGLSVLPHAAGGEDGIPAQEVPAPGRQQQLIHMVRQDCGSCHGLTLRGGLGPALLPETLHSKSVDDLQAIILRGRAGTPMPGWQGLLSENDARWIASQLRDGFPDER
jgi:cytochrome c55X